MIPARLVLFDIDGTLVVTGRAGVRAMNRAIQELFGVGDALAGVALAGRTDRAILEEALRHLPQGSLDADGVASRFRATYVERLREEIAVSPPGQRKGVLPGVVPLLERLAATTGVTLALLTGNFPETAEVKLGYFGLWDYFAWGVFGDAHADRNELIAVALERASANGIGALDPAAVVVIGDTPHDVACARAGGARAIGVASGGYYDRAALESSGADCVFDDLGDTRAVMAALGL